MRHPFALLILCHTNHSVFVCKYLEDMLTKLQDQSKDKADCTKPISVCKFVWD